MSNAVKSTTYSVSGTHCHACEILIEKEINALPGIKSVEAISSKGTVKIIGSTIPAVPLLNKIFKDSGYVFSDSASAPEVKTDIFTSLLIVIGLLAVFFFVSKLGIFSSFSISQSSVLPSFFLFGLLAGFSTCAALVGGVVLSLTKQWGSLYSSSDSALKHLQPVIMFNLGRLIFFSLFGAILGLFGSFLHLSLTGGAIVAILVSLIMVALGLQMLGVKGFSSFQLTLPKSITSHLSDETKFQGQFMPLLMGGLTFFLPCGFTLTVQSLSLASGNPFQGALIMGLFALGTFLPLFLIGYSGIRSQSNPTTAKYFSQVAGILVIIFALINVKSQLNVLGYNLISTASVPTSSQNNLPQIVNGRQILKMTATAGGYTPNFLRVKAGIPVSWQITSSGNAGCAGALVARSFFSDIAYLTPNSTFTKEFIPTTPGTYRFSCSMGMYTGTIEVVN